MGRGLLPRGFGGEVVVVSFEVCVLSRTAPKVAPDSEASPHPSRDKVTAVKPNPWKHHIVIPGLNDKRVV